MKVDKNIKKCPYCGGGTYYIKQYYSGYGNWYMNFDGTESDNSNFHGSAIYKNVSKYAWCADCNRRLFKLED